MIWWLLGCLPLAESTASAPMDLRRDNPRFTQAELRATHPPIWTGTVEGHPCAGAVLVEFRAQSSQLSFLELVTTRYVLYLPNQPNINLRFGCDVDRDGVVPAAAVGSLTIKTLSTATVALWLPPGTPAPLALLKPFSPDAPQQQSAVVEPGVAPVDTPPGAAPGAMPGAVPGAVPGATPEALPTPPPLQPGGLVAPQPLNTVGGLSAPAPAPAPTPAPPP